MEENTLSSSLGTSSLYQSLTENSIDSLFDGLLSKQMDVSLKSNFNVWEINPKSLQWVNYLKGLYVKGCEQQ